MAKSGSNTTWSSNGGHYVKVTWNETSQSVANNRSAVTVRLYVGSKSGWTINDSTNSYSLVIDGSTYSGSNANINQSGSEQLIMTQSVLINHNSDGTRSFSMRGSVSGLYFGGITGSSFSGTLDRIARASTFAGSSTTDLTAGVNKTVSINRQSTNFYHQVRMYLTRGSEEFLLRTENYDASTTSKTITWSNGEISNFWREGHGYYTGTKFILDTYSGGSVIFTTTQTGSLTYPSNNTIGSLSGNFDAGQSVGVTLNRPTSLYSHEAQLRVPDGTVVASRGISTATSFSMTADEATLYQKAPNSSTISVQLWIRTVLTADTNRQVFGWTNEGSVTARLNGAPPTPGSFSYVDTNATTVGLTGNAQHIVSGKSTPRFTVGTATAASGASIVDYTVSVSGQTLSRTTAGTLDFGALSAQSNTTATLTVRDSRGLTASTSVLVTVLPHMNPTLNASVSRASGFENATTLKVNGTFSSVGSKNNVGAATAIQYRYRLTPSGSFNTWTNIGKTTSGTSFTGTDVNLSLPNTNAYQFEVKVVDAFGGTTTVQRNLGAGKPIMHIDTERNAVSVNMFPTITNGFQVDGISDLRGHTTVTGNLSVSGNATVNTITPSSAYLNVSGVSSELLRLTANSGTHGYMSIYDGGTRVGYMGSTSNGSRIMRVHADAGPLILRGSSNVDIAVGSSTNLTVGSSQTISENNIQQNGNLSMTGNLSVGGSITAGLSSVEGSLIHTGGYLHVRVFNETASHYSSASASTQRGEVYFSGASNNRFIFVARTNAGSVVPTSVQASSFPTSSSIQYKEFIADYTKDALACINGTRIRTYNFKHTPMAHRKVGVIIEEGVPDEIIDPAGDAIDTYAMTAMSWKAIQQLTQQNEAQQQSIEYLEGVVHDLMARIESLES